MAQRQIINGGFQDALGNPLNLGYLTMHLNTDAVTGTNVQICAGRVVLVPLDSSGNVSGVVLIWPNDQLTPTDTVYFVQAYSAQGQLAWQGQQLVTSGGGSFDLNTWVPSY